MTIAVIVLALALVAAIAANVWLVYGRVAAADHVADARVGQVSIEAELERAQYELKTTSKALAAAQARAAALEEELLDEIDNAPNPDLPVGDARGRVLRLARRWAEADTASRDGAVPAEPDTAVPEPPAATAPRAHVYREG